ncbi:MAG: hypothetical protein BCS36_11955 [Desulfovibrio sp. MES5]|nr:MAG: hypothetical protein BCS36_11955 [Desulfovibrio sp. MES5]
MKHTGPIQADACNEGALAAWALAAQTVDNEPAQLRAFPHTLYFGRMSGIGMQCPRRFTTVGEVPALFTSFAWVAGACEMERENCVQRLAMLSAALAGVAMRGVTNLRFLDMFVCSRSTPGAYKVKAPRRFRGAFKTGGIAARSRD